MYRIKKKKKYYYPIILYRMTGSGLDENATKLDICKL